MSRLSNISFSLFHFCTYNNKRRFKLLPLKNKKNGIFGKCANIQISFKVEWPKKEFQNGELWRCIIASLIEMQICYFFLEKSWKNWKAMKVCEEECKVWRPDLFQRLQKLHLILFSLNGFIEWWKFQKMELKFTQIERKTFL